MDPTIETTVELSHGAVTWALESGYRHIDTAALYANEREVGEAIRSSGIDREEVFLTTKLWNSDHGYDRALQAFDDSLSALGFDYVDLYLLHWPVEGLRGDSWRALERLLDEGRTRAIGVSNYTVRHLQDLLGQCATSPAVNQVEFSPFLYQRELLGYCRTHGIQLEAYSPLTKGHRLADPRLLEVAGRYDKSTAQILIRWALQHDLVVIPKSADKARIAENAAVFDFALGDDDMANLDALHEDLHTSWDPTDAP
jgi:diketogulonate reductase-like aldo/keto reductase